MGTIFNILSVLYCLIFVGGAIMLFAQFADKSEKVYFTILSIGFSISFLAVLAMAFATA